MEIVLLRLERRVRRGNENGDPLVECLVSVALLAVELIMSTIVWLIRTLNTTVWVIVWRRHDV